MSCWWWRRKRIRLRGSWSHQKVTCHQKQSWRDQNYSGCLTCRASLALKINKANKNGKNWVKASLTKEAVAEELPEDILRVPEGEVGVSVGEVVLVPWATGRAASVETLFAVLVVYAPFLVCKKSFVSFIDQNFIHIFRQIVSKKTTQKMQSVTHNQNEAL